MPAFMFIAGYVMALGEKGKYGLSGYLSFESRKIARLILPYIAISFLQLLIKIPLRVTRLSEVPEVLMNMFIAPHAGPAPHGWFLYLLMLIFVIWPLLRRLVNRNGLPLIFALLFFFAILPISWPKKNPISYYFELERLTWYFPIFVFGYWYYYTEKDSRHQGFSSIVIAGCIFVGSFLIRLQYMDAYSLSIPCPNKPVLSFLLNLVRMVGCICGTLCLLWISGRLTIFGGTITSFVAKLGLYSYDIYLLHVVVGHLLVVAVSKLRMNEWESLALFPAVVSCTIAIAYLLGQFIRQFPRFAFVMLGLPIREPDKVVQGKLFGSGKAGAGSG
jgi:peptidoglycan/LPS O-acetylase OafA/YrhL